MNPDRKTDFISFLVQQTLSGAEGGSTEDVQDFFSDRLADWEGPSKHLSISELKDTLRSHKIFYCRGKFIEAGRCFRFYHSEAKPLDVPFDWHVFSQLPTFSSGVQCYFLLNQHSDKEHLLDVLGSWVDKPIDSIALLAEGNDLYMAMFSENELQPFLALMQFIYQEQAEEFETRTVA